MDKTEDNNRTIWSREVKKVREVSRGWWQDHHADAQKMSRKVDGKVEVGEVVG